MSFLFFFVNEALYFTPLMIIRGARNLNGPFGHCLFCLSHKHTLARHWKYESLFKHSNTCDVVNIQEVLFSFCLKIIHHHFQEMLPQGKLALSRAITLPIYTRNWLANLFTMFTYIWKFLHLAISLQNIKFIRSCKLFTFSTN